MSATDSKTYFAKSTTFGIAWRSPWLTEVEAKRAAKQFVEQWREVGRSVSSRVFYRDGSAVSDFRIAIVKDGCGDCDPCVGGRPDQCAVGGVSVSQATEFNAAQVI